LDPGGRRGSNLYLKNLWAANRKLKEKEGSKGCLYIANNGTLTIAEGAERVQKQKEAQNPVTVQGQGGRNQCMATAL
jgi:hypothetical protein